MRLIPYAAASALLHLASGAGPSGAAPESIRPLRWLALGDSYTIGEGVEEQDRWPMQVGDLLQAQGYPTQVTIIARTGWTGDELWAGIQSARPSPPYDLVSLLIGVNNQYRGRGLDEYRQQFRFLMGKALTYAAGQAGRVLVLSIPDWGVTLFGRDRDPERIAREIDLFNEVNRDEASAAGVGYVDITPETRRDGADPEYIASDGLHPSRKMYAEWARLALPVVLRALQGH